MKVEKIINHNLTYDDYHVSINIIDASESYYLELGTFSDKAVASETLLSMADYIKNFVSVKQFLEMNEIL